MPAKSRIASARATRAASINRFSADVARLRSQWRWISRDVIDGLAQKIDAALGEIDFDTFALAQNIDSGRVELSLPDEPRPLFDRPSEVRSSFEPGEPPFGPSPGTVAPAPVLLTFRLVNEQGAAHPEGIKIHAPTVAEAGKIAAEWCPGWFVKIDRPDSEEPSDAEDSLRRDRRRPDGLEHVPGPDRAREHPGRDRDARAEALSDRARPADESEGLDPPPDHRAAAEGDGEQTGLPGGADPDSLTEPPGMDWKASPEALPLVPGNGRGREYTVSTHDGTRHAIIRARDIFAALPEAKAFLHHQSQCCYLVSGDRQESPNAYRLLGSGHIELHEGDVPAVLPGKPWKAPKKRARKAKADPVPAGVEEGLTPVNQVRDITNMIPAEAPVPAPDREWVVVRHFAESQSLSRRVGTVEAPDFDAALARAEELYGGMGRLFEVFDAESPRASKYPVEPEPGGEEDHLRPDEHRYHVHLEDDGSGNPTFLGTLVAVSLARAVEIAPAWFHDNVVVPGTPLVVVPAAATAGERWPFGTELSECLSCGERWPKADSVGCPSCVHGPAPEMPEPPQVAPVDGPSVVQLAMRTNFGGASAAEPGPLADGCRCIWTDNAGREWSGVYRFMLGDLASLTLDVAPGLTARCIRVRSDTVRRDPADGWKPEARRCRGCGCTDGDCRCEWCAENRHTGVRCHWVEPDMCPVCLPPKPFGLATPEKPARKSPTKTFRAVYRDDDTDTPIDCGTFRARDFDEARRLLPGVVRGESVRLADGRVVALNLARIEVVQVPATPRKKKEVAAHA
jgi:hypothetical protein